MIGAPKSGTTSIASYLSKHPDVYCPVKEPRFFDACTYYDYKEDYPINSLDDYLLLYNRCSKSYKYILDASVFNMYSLQSIHDILNLNPLSKFIICLRDPLSASKSMHKQRLKYFEPRLRELSEDFYTCWDMLPSRQSGNCFPKGCRNKFLFRYDLLYRYELYIPIIHDLIPKKNLLILNYNDYLTNQNYTLHKIYQFLNIAYFDLQFKNVNSSYVTKKTISNFLKVYTRRLLGNVPFKNTFKDYAIFSFIEKKLRLSKYHKNIDYIDDELDSFIRVYFSKSYSTLIEYTE